MDFKRPHISRYLINDAALSKILPILAATLELATSSQKGASTGYRVQTLKCVGYPVSKM